ncbi:MAG: hypothetical protein L3J24_00315 [Xanthomonadales bacterium]|nr:hypothetical protein [Xanthomonadales bacterium]
MTIETLPSNIFCTEIAEGQVVANDIFQRKFFNEAPADPHHLFVIYQAPDGTLSPLSYVHFMPVGDICLVGGGCTDGRVFNKMTDSERNTIKLLDGVFYYLLRYGFERFSDEFSAFFGYCGNERAESIDLRAGFKKTEHKHLLKHIPKPLHPTIERALIAKAHAIGLF